MIWPARALQARGHDVTVVMPRDRGNSLHAQLDADDNVIDVSWPEDADVIVLQRISHQRLVKAIEIMVNRGLKVIIDIDDDLAAIDPQNPAWKAMHPTHGHSGDNNWLNVQAACDVASLVTVSTDALLQRYARRTRGIVLRNCVPERYLDVMHTDSDVIGWGGSLHVHPGDVQVLGTAVNVLITTGSKFRVVGPGTGVADALRCSADIIEATGPRNLHNEWPNALTTLGIGIAPLADTRFNRAKSWLKVLEYSALGVPWVASPRAEYQRAHKMSGTGLLADKPKHWQRALRTLRDSAQLRQESSEAGRAWAATQTIEANAWRWAEAWYSVVDVA